jgi:hypothetical protein
MLIVLGLLVAGPAAIAQQQPGEPQGQDGAREHRRDRRDGPTEEQRQEWRQRRERMRTATPQERQQMRLDRWVDMTARTYDLDEPQKTTVRKELEAMQAERRAQMGADADEYDRLRDKMGEMWAKAQEEAEKSDGGGGDGGQGGRRRGMGRGMRENPEFQELQKRIEEFDQKYPFDMEAAMQRVEKLLPPEQVKKGRERWEQRTAQWRDRQQNRGSGEQGRGPGMRDRPRPDGTGGPGAAGGPPGGTGAGAQGGATGPAGGTPPGEPPKPPPAQPPQPAPQPPKELHPWEKYVRDFCAHFEVTDAQNASAMSILKDVQKRAAAMEAANASKITAAQQIKDAAQRAAKLKELNKPIDNLFEELKKRLDGLLTAAQRAKKAPMRV